MDKEDFYIFPFKHKDVILGALWYCVHAHMKFSKRKVLFTCKVKDYALTCNGESSFILVVAPFTFDIVIKNFVYCYMVFVKDHENSISELNESISATKEVLDLSNFLKEF